MNARKLASVVVVFLLLSTVYGRRLTAVEDTHVETALPLRRAASGEYVLDAKLGEQKFALLLDTASAELVVAGKGCSGCDESPNARFDASASKTFRSIPCGSLLCSSLSPKDSCPSACGFSVDYEDGSSVSGSLGVDELALGSLRFPAPVGVINKQPTASLLAPDIDGILGVAPAATHVSVMRWLAQSGALPWTMTLCLSESGGSIIFGGVDDESRTALYKPPLRWASMALSPFYAVQLRYIRVGKHKLSAEGAALDPLEYGAVLDSGASSIVLAANIFDELQKTFTDHYCHLPGVCSEPSLFDSFAKLSSDDVASFPDLHWEMEDGLVLTLQPQHYLVNASGLTRLAITRAQPEQDVGIVLGGALLQAYYVVIDHQRGRVGFARSLNCSAPTHPTQVVWEVADVTPAVTAQLISVAVIIATTIALRRLCATGS
eukprot:PLAT617.1.p1 GENE.PLAT617.1~~PLAT617.1.p1  ORF type:complete len:434 (+),score=109.05 PLAT617.1:227-1528(+)